MNNHFIVVFIENTQWQIHLLQFGQIRIENYTVTLKKPKNVEKSHTKV